MKRDMPQTKALVSLCTRNRQAPDRQQERAARYFPQPANVVPTLAPAESCAAGTSIARPYGLQGEGSAQLHRANWATNNKNQRVSSWTETTVL